MSRPRKIAVTNASVDENKPLHGNTVGDPAPFRSTVRIGQYGPRAMRLLVARCEVLYTAGVVELCHRLLLSPYIRGVGVCRTSEVWHSSELGPPDRSPELQTPRGGAPGVGVDVRGQCIADVDSGSASQLPTVCRRPSRPMLAATIGTQKV